MSLTWPWALAALLVLPVLLRAYRDRLRRQAGARAELTRQGLVPAGGRGDRSRHLAPALLGASLALMLLALARPVAAVAEPRREGTLVLAFDVSTSMAAKDGSPTRLDAARAAADAFVAKQPEDVRIGVVAFGGTAVVTQAPTTDRGAVAAAIGRLRAEGETAVGRGIVAALGAIAGRPLVPARPAPAATGSTATSAPAPETLDGVDIGYYGGTAVVLLTDGESTVGVDPGDAAHLAATAGVKVYPIGLGSPGGTTLQADGFTLATSLDESVLEAVAQTTGGSYANAPDASALARVFDAVQLKWTTRSVTHEVTSWVATLALMLLALGAGVSVLRTGRVV
ncbi:VWA domain-containing protein [Dermatophilaceae bacterium Soc4.6]